MEFLDIKSGQGDYRVDFLPQVSTIVERLETFENPVFLIDRNVAELYSTQFSKILNSSRCFLIDALEKSKTLEGVSDVIGFLQGINCSRHNMVVAIGGGIIQDIATFVAHVYHRGLKLILVPTTLLAMSDSCIGAKSGLNYKLFKNQIGVFHSPSCVLISSRFIDTLTETDIKSGYGEILKLMLIGSQELFEEFYTTLQTDGFYNNNTENFIKNSLAVKKRYIEADEYESNSRRILNYGHTFGHALESITDHQVCHGMAVAWGLNLANFISMRMGMLAPNDYSRISELIKSHFALGFSKNISGAEILDHVRRDKKAAAGKINSVMLKSPGDLNIIAVDLGPELEQHIDNFLERPDVIHSN